MLEQKSDLDYFDCSVARYWTLPQFPFKDFLERNYYYYYFAFVKKDFKKA